MPPYSPDFTPIEQSFAEIKAWMKRNRKKVLECGFEAFYEEAVMSKYGSQGNHFRSCNINCIDDWEPDEHEYYWEPEAVSESEAEEEPVIEEML